MQEIAYNPEQLGEFVQENEPYLVLDQRNTFEEITDTVFNKKESIFFIEAAHGTGKIFLAVASADIAKTFWQNSLFSTQTTIKNVNC